MTGSDHDSVQRVETRASAALEKNVTKVVHEDGTVDLMDRRAQGGELENMPRGYYTSPQFIGTLVAQCTGSICAYLGWVLPANTLSLINADLGNSKDINWVATVWTLGSCIGFLLVGRISDLFGRKSMVMSTMVLGLIACILGACAQNITMLIVANLLNGIAAAGQLSFGIVMGELVPNKMRGVIVTIVFASSMPFAVFGPVIARSFINNTASKWRWSYFLGIIFSVITLVLYQFLYHPPTFAQLHVGKTKLQQAKEMDFIGIFLFIAGCVLSLVGLSWGGTSYPWTSAETLGTLIAGIATLALFVVYEGFWCKVPPLMPPRLFKNWGFVGTVGAASVAAMVYYSLTIIWPMIIGNLYTTDIMQIGWESSVIGGGILLGQIIGGIAFSYVPRAKFQAIVCAFVSAAFITPLATLTPESHSMVLGLGICCLVAIGYIDNIVFPGVTMIFNDQDIGLATGVMGSIRALSGAVAQAVYVNVLQNELKVNIPEKVGAAVTAAGLPSASLPGFFAGMTAGNFTGVAGVTPAVLTALDRGTKMAWQQSFKIVFFVTIPFSVILIISSFLIPNVDNVQKTHVSRRLQGKLNDVEGGSSSDVEKHEVEVREKTAVQA